MQCETYSNEVLDWQQPHVKWFHDGTLNVVVNCLDRHVEAGNGDRVARALGAGDEGDASRSSLHGPAR